MDLRDDPETIKEFTAKWQRYLISWEEGYALAKKIGAYAYLECSAKTREGVKQVFEIAAQAALLPEKTRRKLEQKSIEEKLKILSIESLRPKKDLCRLGKLMDLNKHDIILFTSQINSVS